MALGQILSHSLSHHELPVVPATRAHESYPPASLSKNLNRLLSAAVVSPRFRGLLLTDPVAALAVGYNGEEFHLTAAEYAAVTSLRVASIRDFATQLLRVMHFATSDSALYASDAQADLRFVEVAAH